MNISIEPNIAATYISGTIPWEDVVFTIPLKEGVVALNCGIIYGNKMIVN